MSATICENTDLAAKRVARKAAKQQDWQAYVATRDSW